MRSFQELLPERSENHGKCRKKSTLMIEGEAMRELEDCE